MKRLHIHISVSNLAESIKFYTALFASDPTVTQSDYAKWMLENPFHTLETIPTFNEHNAKNKIQSSPCCIPLHKGR